MAKGSCKCKKAGECEECPEWIFTFADLVMLMMGFFVILWVTKPSPTKQTHDAAESTPDESELIKFEAAARVAFGFKPGNNDNDPVSTFIKTHDMSHVMLSGPHDGGKTEHEKGIEGTDLTVTTLRPSKQATTGGKMLFDVGSSELNPQTKAALDQLAREFKGHPNIVMIKGHTSLDDFPDNATALQKMDLSLKRAQAAEDYMIQQGVEPRIIRIQGCSTFEPLTTHDYSPDAQDDNRRIEVESTGTLETSFEGNSTTRPALQP